MLGTREPLVRQDGDVDPIAVDSVLEPDFPVAHNNLAIAYMESGDYELAAKHYDKAVSLGYGVAEEVRKEIEEKRQG